MSVLCFEWHQAQNVHFHSVGGMHVALPVGARQGNIVLQQKLNLSASGGHVGGMC